MATQAYGYDKTAARRSPTAAGFAAVTSRDQRATAMTAPSFLRVFSPDSVPVTHQGSPVAVAAGAESFQPIDTRSTRPGVAMVRLSDLYDSWHTRAADSKTESSWSGYRTLLRHWSAHHGGPGPDVRQITEPDLLSFFESVEAWNSRRSWKKNRDLLFALLKSGCPRTNDNRDGTREDPPLQLDALPVLELPRDRWFRDRDDKRPPAKRRGGHRSRKLPVMTPEQFGDVLNATRDDVCSRLWWISFLSFVWFCGPRLRDVWRYRWTDGRQLIDLDRQVAEFTETKSGGESIVPLPSWLLFLFGELHSAQNAEPGDPVFVCDPRTKPDAGRHRLSRGDAANETRAFRPSYKATFLRAGVPLRQPHELRANAQSLWFKHSEKYRFAATGHQPPSDDVQLRHYIRLDDDFAAAAESFPFPLTVPQLKELCQ